jgi:hypothetical protein
MEKSFIPLERKQEAFLIGFLVNRIPARLID